MSEAKSSNDQPAEFDRDELPCGDLFELGDWSLCCDLPRGHDGNHSEAGTESGDSDTARTYAAAWSREPDVVRGQVIDR